MTSYQPPTEDLAIFDSSVFLSGDEPLTYNQAVKKFLKYPNAQGTENLLTTNVNGVLTANDDVVFSPSTDIKWDRADANYLINDTLPKTITTGINNIALGKGAVDTITSGQGNIGIGTNACSSLQTSSNNIGIGQGAIGALTSGSQNTCAGLFSLQKATSGDYNVCVGSQSLRDHLTPSKMVSIGYNSNVATTSGNNCTAVGAEANNGNFSDCTALGHQATNTASNQVRLGRATETVSCPGTLTFKMASDNNSGTFYIPFSKVAGGTEGALFVDDVTGPLTYNPSTATLSCTSVQLTTVNGPATNSTIDIGTNNINGDIAIGQAQNTGRILIGSTSRTSGAINIMNGSALNGAVLNMITNNYTGASGATCNLLTGSPTIGPATLNIMTGTKPVASNLTIGGSANVNIFLNSRTVFANPIVTNVTTAPTITNQLGYTTSKTSGWSNITNSATNLNTIAIDGAVIEFGVYKIDVFVNYTNGAANQNFRVGVSDTTLTLPTPLVVRSTQSGQDDGVFISQTISAFTNTTFYIVAQSSNAVGATLYTAGARTSGIYLTRIA
jgi:hypothetical protein